MIFFPKEIKFLFLVLNIETYVCVTLIHYDFFLLGWYKTEKRAEKDGLLQQYAHGEKDQQCK